MSFVWKMAWRDSRSQRRRLLLYSLSIVLGVAALVAIGSFTENLTQAIDAQTKGLLGADLIVTSRSAPGPQVQQFLEGLGGEQAHDYGFSSMLVYPAANNLTRLVQVRAMDGLFPFYGDFTTLPSSAVAELRRAQTEPARAKNEGRVVILEDTILRQLGASVGDMVKLGQGTFEIIGALEKLPGESSAVAATFAPRALIPMRALAATGLMGKPTLARFRTMLKLPVGVDPEIIAPEMRTRFAGERLSFDTVERRKRELGRTFENVRAFLSLVGFVALFLGGIGVASAIGVYVRQKVATVATLRCLGASARQSFGVYVIQGFALGIFGAALGALLGVVIQLTLPALFRGFLPVDVDFFIAWPALLRGASAGLVICVLFALLPLLAIRKVSPLAALRTAYAERAVAAPDPWRIAVGVMIGVAVMAFAVWQTQSLRLGLGFSGMVAVGLALLAGVARAVVWLARRLNSGPKRRLRGLPYVWRQGVANLYRPQNRTTLLLFALGLGTFQILTLYLTRTTLLREIEISGGSGRPNLLFFDIQDDEIGPLTQRLAKQGAPVQISAPIVTMRIASINGRSVESLLSEGRGTEKAKAGTRGRPPDGAAPGRLPAWALRREYRSTFRDRLSGTEKIVAGDFVGHVAPDTALVPISIEEGLRRDMQLKLGDEIDWDVQGVPLRSRIASVRAVEWRRLEPNFFVVFPTGALDAAPKVWVVALRAETTADSARIQRAVVAAFPNVTAIDLALIMETLDGVFSKVALAVQFLALFTVLTGVIVLAGAVLTGRYQRIRETVLLRTVGATRRQLTRIMMVEYAVLGVLAACTGVVLALVANFLLARYVFKTAAAASPLDLVGAVIGVVAVTLITGTLANRGVTDHPPLEVLRQET